MKILVPIDIDHLRDNFVTELKALVPLSEAEVILLYVREELPSVESILDSIAEFQDDWRNQVLEKVRGEFKKLEGELADLTKKVSHQIVSGPPALMIETVAKDEQVDLIVMLPIVHGKMEQFLLGTTSNRVVRHAATSVLILRWPQTGKGRKLQNVIMCIDGSEEAFRAAERASSLFQLGKSDATISLINVVTIVPIFKFVTPVRFVAAIEDNLTMSGEASLAQAQKRLADQGVGNVVYHLVSGDPAAEILKLQERLSAELIVLGALGRGAVEEMLLGGVSAKVAAHAKCSIAVIK